eukprot:CAMPEP_0184211812 /NCGR_PEP_ID=MMETSP0976-20121227/13319_1 /TAXON_ID=483370 /ORGANISM="non described non described, Strain CCMP2097" /LENGTH=506 /DNA_ID=CAMNT_0026516521 /DNA_START=1 /DNA_END=1517 /DNA_ORIENTATION=+
MRVVETASSGDVDVEDFGLAQLLAPMPLETFLESHWRKTPLVIRGESKDRFAEILQAVGGGNVELLCANTASEKIFCWVKAPDGRTLRSVELDDPRGAGALHAAGHAIYCRAPEGLEDSLVSALLNDTDLGLGEGSLAARGEVEMFCAKQGHQTPKHFDFQENFTLQLQGSKTWHLSHSGIANPLRADSSHFDDTSVFEDQSKARSLDGPPGNGADGATDVAAAEETATQGKKKKRAGDGGAARKRPKAAPSALAPGAPCTVTLHAGDALYFPAGAYHAVDSNADDNMSLNVSLMGPNWADVVSAAVRHAMLTRLEFREGVSHRNAEETMSRLLSTLRDDVVPLLTARRLLPPALRDATRRGGAAASDEEEEDGGDDGDEDGGDEDGGDDGEEEEEDDSSSEEADDFIDVSTFEASPAAAAELAAARGPSLPVNPFAHITSLADSRTAVNVLFGGTVSLESALRVELKLSPATHALLHGGAAFLYVGGKRHLRRAAPGVDAADWAR